MDADEAAGFEEGLEEADDHYLGWGGGEGGAEGEDAPDETCCWEPDSGADLLEDEVVGDLAEEVAAVEDLFHG